MKEFVHLTGIAVAFSQVRTRPTDVIDLVAYIGADDVSCEDFVQEQMWVIHANKNNSSAISSVNEDLVEEPWSWNLTAWTIDEDIESYAGFIPKLSNSERSCVSFEVNVSIGRQRTR